MIRSELVARIAARNPHLRVQEVEAVVDAILDRIADALAKSDRVELRGFGVFETRRRETRARRNPRTRAVVDVPAGISVRFKPGRGMHALLNADKGIEEVLPPEEADSLAVAQGASS